MNKDLENGYMLHFEVVSINSVNVTLLKNADPTLIDTNYIKVTSTEIVREADQSRTHSAFALLASAEAINWAKEQIAVDKEVEQLSIELRKALNDTA